MTSSPKVRLGVLTVALVVITLGPTQAEAGGWLRRRTAPAQTAYRVSSVPPGPLGTFAPTPMLMVRGDGPTGSGYSPLGESGDSTLSLYGPLSPFRATSAPVLTYTRGYDGRLVTVPGTSFSTPNSPSLSPVVYPAQSTNFYGPRVLKSPPWWADGSTWIDQN